MPQETQTMALDQDGLLQMTEAATRPRAEAVVVRSVAAPARWPGSAHAITMRRQVR